MRFSALLCSLFIYGCVNADDISTEDIFSKAEKYTLELAVDITTPFIYDEAGSYGGTAFLIDKKRGWVLTNAHVIGKSPSIVRGRFKDGKYQPLKKIYIDPVIDMAVIQIDTDNIPSNAQTANLDCLSEPKTGHPIGTFGHPWSTSFTATRGIVSGTTYLDNDEWLQVDAPINHGNSGGPLISLKSGLIVGISSATGSEDTEGLGFALPIKRVCTILDLLRNNSDPSPPNFGVIFFQHDEEYKLKVSHVINTGIDLQEGDVIKKVEGKDINYEIDLIDILRGKSEVSATIEREGYLKNVTWKITPMKKVIGSKAISFSGMLITTNNWIDSESTGNSDTWLINSVADGTLSQSYGVEEYDLITNFNNKVFSDIDALYTFLLTIEPKSDINLVIKEYSGLGTRLYDYYDLDINVNDLKIEQID